MGAGKTDKTGWSLIPVQIRSDILAAAGQEKIDIADICNTALACQLGITYRTPQKPKPASGPVIIAPNAACPPVGQPGPGSSPMTAPSVINAEDPMAPARVIREKKSRKAGGSPTPSPGLSAPPESLPKVPVEVPGLHPEPKPDPAPSGIALAGTRVKKSPAKSGKKDDLVKKFVNARIVRVTEESADTVVGKDELYLRFERWCREQDAAKIPDRRTFTVALKNRFAIPERTVGGEPCWVSIRIQ
ncbi:MAG: hypothetical protein WC342_06925 [Methanoregula sp.]|jgi:hypothetical protein